MNCIRREDKGCRYLLEGDPSQCTLNYCQKVQDDILSALRSMVPTLVEQKDEVDPHLLNFLEEKRKPREPMEPEEYSRLRNLQTAKNISDLHERYLKPAASRIAEETDKLLLQETAIPTAQKATPKRTKGKRDR